MNRLRRKSDARSRSAKAANAGDSSANLGSHGSTTPAGEPPSVQLPNAEEFRTSLILPNLMRRFSLLRGQDGQLVDLQTIQNHLAIQRQTGRLTAYEVDAVLEQYKLQTGIESTASSPSLPKRKRIDWSLVEDEAAFLDSLSQAPSSSSTSFVTVNDETQSSLASSMTRSRVPAPPVPSDLGHSATLLPSLGSSGLDSSSPPTSARSVPLSRESSSSGGASSTSQGYPYRVKRGTNGLFGGRALDARELKMLRSTSGHSLEASPRSTEGPVGDRVEGNKVELDRVPATQSSPDPGATTTALSPTASMKSSEPYPQTSFTDSSAPSTPARDGDDEEPSTSASHPAGASTAVLADSPTTPLSANQLRRISTALEAIEVQLAKTFTRMSWAAELDEDEEDVGRRDSLRAAEEEEEEEEEEGVEAQAVDHLAQAEKAAIDAAEERSPAFDGRRSPDLDAMSPSNVPDSPGDEITTSTGDDYHQLFDMSRASDDTVPPSPISPITDSDLRGVGTFEAAAAPRSEFEAMTDLAAVAASEVEELDPSWNQTAAGATTSSSDAPAVSAFSSERIPFGEVSPETEGNSAGAAVGGSTQDGGGDALASTPDNEDEAGTDHVVPLSDSQQPQAFARRAPSARASLARESFASFRSTGSSFHPVDDARLHSDEDFGLPITASQNSALPSEIDAFSSRLPSPSGSGNAEPRPQRISALAIDTSALAARPASLSFDRRPTEELLQVLAAATKRLSASGAADKDLYLTHEDVLAIQARLVRNAAAQKAAPIEANVEEDGTAEDRPVPIADGSDESPTESARPQEEASEDEAVERLAGLGLDDFASTDFTQPSPQQANARVFAAGTAESSPGSSAGKPSPVSYLRSPASVSMAAQNSQRTYDSNVTFSSAPSGATTSPSDAFEYSSLVTSRTDLPEHGTPPSVLAATSGTAPTETDGVESSDAPNAFASADDPSRSGETLPASEMQGVEVELEAPTRDSATVERPAMPSVEPSTVESSTAADSPQRVPRRTPAPDRSGATSILVRDVRNQATLATNALKQHETGASPPRLLRKKSVRKQSISSPQLVSGPINIPAVPIASPKIIAEARSAFANAATEDSPSALRRTRSVSDSKSKAIGSRFKRLLSKREGGNRPDADADTAAGTTRSSSKPARPSRAGADPITPPNQSTARFGSPQQSSPQTPSTIMSSPGGSTPRSSPRKKPVPSNVFPSKRSSLSQSHPSSPETARNGDTSHARNQSFSQAFATLPENPASGVASDAAPEAVNDQQYLEQSVSFTRVEPLSPRRTESGQDSTRTRSPTSPSTFRSGTDRSARFSRDSVESMLRFRQAAEGLGLDPDKVQELVSSAYAGSSSHAYSGSISSSNDGNATLENHDDSWGRYREASHGSNATAAAQANDRAREAHAHLRDAVSDDSAPAEPSTGSSFGQQRHFSSLSRFADTGFAPPSMLAVPDRSGTLDSLAGPRSPGVESTTSRQSSSGYASSFLDYYAHEEGETDNEGPFNLSTGSTFDPRGDASIRFSLADSADAQPASARVSGAPSGEVVWQVLDDLRTNRFSIASQGSSLGFGSHDSSNGADDPALVDQLAPVATLLRHRDRKRSSASMSSEWDRGRYPSIYLREEQALIELAQQGGIAVDESGRFLVRPKLDAPAVPPLPAEYRDQAHVVVDSATAAQPLELPGPNRSDDATPTHADPSSSPLAR